MSENLANFTDILGDDDHDDVIDDSQESQPISLPSSAEYRPKFSNNVSCKRVRPAKGTGQYNEFRSVVEIDRKYRDVFNYPFFNLVQSRVIDDALYSDKSMVVCAPTGSGKTVVFEMAIVQLLMEIEANNSSEDFKIIYMAPVKALCTERLTEWYSKFTRLGLMCIEVTGDTDVDFTQLLAYKIIITTPEKWDMLTRRWKDHRALVEMIKLFLIDEVHILNDETRGPVLEAVVSRMKTVQSAAQSAHRIEKLQKQYQNSSVGNSSHTPKDPNIAPTIRFVAVSATVSNPEDVAAWLNTDDKPAVYYKFGDECRPVKLRRVVEGYPCPDGTSIFKFDIILNYKLWPIIQKYHDGKPTLIFCNTRKSVQLTAETLSKEITITFSAEQKMKLTALASTIRNKKLQSLVLAGVGCHHAGLLYEERTYIEHAFRNGDLPILITTTTLAMGVNLPAHLVIIKNTMQYVKGAYQEYSISTILQMVGRAGRPQFDTDATAVIMTRLRDKARYQALAGGSEPLQSYLHKRLAENLNSETALGTVSDVAQCVQWLRSTFLYVRAAKDPKRYLGLTSTAPDYLILKKIEELCVRAMNGLASAGLITMDEASCIESTEAGRLMSVFYLDLETMKILMKIEGNESLEYLLWIICECHELADMHLRTDERRTLNALNRNNTAATIRFAMKGKISTRQMKLSCIIQAVLGCLPIPDPSLNQEAMKIMRIADRVCKCLVSYVTRPEPVAMQLQYFSAVLNAIILAKCIAAHLWENSPYVSKQLKGIGPTFSTLLATAGKVNFMLLEESHPRDLERIMNKGPPAGNVIRKQISLLPKYQLEATPVDERTVSVKLLLLNQAHLSENMDSLTAGPTHKCYVIAGDSKNHILLLANFVDKDLISVYNGAIIYQITRKHGFEHKIFVHCVSSSFVGLDAQCEYTFTDLMSASLHIENMSSHLFEGNTKKTLKKQINALDTPNGRKRKNYDEISQSKEKKKRDNALAEKFTLLKESFGRTSTVLKKDLQKTEEMTKNVLSDLGYSNQPRSESISDTNNDNNTIIIDEDAFNEANIDMNLVEENNDELDDATINSILSEIESEITKVNTEPKLHGADIHHNYSNDYNSKLFNKTTKTVKQKQQLRRRTKKLETTKSNYKFLDLLENNIDLSDDEVPVKETGFSNAIKQQIDNFIQNSNKVPPSIDLTLSNQHTSSIDITTANIKIENTNIIAPSTEHTTNSDKSYLCRIIDLDSQETNNDDFKNCHKNTTYNDLTEEELPQIDITEHITELDSGGISVARKVVDDTHMDIVLKCNDKLIDEQVALKDAHKTIPSQHDEIAKENKFNEELHINDPIRYIYDNDKITGDSIEEELPEINIERPTNGTDINVYADEKNKIIERCDSTNLRTGNTSNNPYNYLHSHESKQFECELSSNTNNPVTFYYIGSCNAPLKFSPPLLNETKDDSVIATSDRNMIRRQNNNNNIHNKIQFTSIYSYDKPVSLTKPFPICDLSSESTNDLRNNHPNTNFELVKADTLRGPNFHPINQVLEANQSAQQPNVDRPNQNYKPEAKVTRKSSKENKYSFTAEKIDVQTKYTTDHRIRVIRRLKVDLDVREIICNYEKNNLENLKQSEHDDSNKQEMAANKITENKSIQRPLEVDNTSFYSLTANQRNTVSKESPTFPPHNTVAYNMIENAQKGDKPATKHFNKVESNTYTPDDTSEVNYANSNDDQSTTDKGIGNILQKYAQIIRRNKSIEVQSSPRLPTSGTNIKQTPFKPNRPFKITDIQNFNVPLPSFSENTNIKPTPKIPQGPQVGIVTSRTETPPLVTSIITTRSEAPTMVTKTQTPPEVLEQVELTPSQSHEHLFEQALDISDNFKIDQSMFNPRKLLQTMRKDDVEVDIIPPPPEFCNDACYSPEVHNNETSNYFDELDHPFEGVNTNVFEDACPDNGNLTPKEIETWTLECEDEFDISLKYATPTQSYTVKRRKMFQNYTRQDHTRQRKLNQFQFNSKNKLKR